MAKLYDKDGKEFNIPHAVDVKDWVKDGYSLDNPKDKHPASVKKETRKTPREKVSES